LVEQWKALNHQKNSNIKVATHRLLVNTDDSVQ
jgi:hypothetical protein